MAAIQVAFDFGNRHGVDDESAEMDGAVPIIEEKGGVLGPAKVIREQPGYRRAQRHSDGRPPPRVPGGNTDRDGVEDEETHLVARDVIQPAEHTQQEEAASERKTRAAFGFGGHRLILIVRAKANSHAIELRLSARAPRGPGTT